MRRITDIDVFATLADRVEIGREREAVEQRERDFMTQEMGDVVLLGEQVVGTGHMHTTEDVVREEWATTNRQRALMSQTGHLILKPEMESVRNRSFDITSKLIKIAPDIGIILRQTTNAVTQELMQDFWQRVKAEGIEVALDAHNKPEFTNYNVIDLRTQLPVANRRLMPRSTWFPQEIASRFAPGTRPTALSLRSRSDCESSAEAKDVDETDDRPSSLKTDRPLTEDEILITAGFITIYNLVLDQVQAELKA